eukprot:TRINITY_DN8186_c0_g1_i2.p1 TRINITY_DN8186_c0_g1~~TRINITY_DN8186_c0_g1_i2.p1  ORF type:complete len:237 (+),score=39.73 TRINITY_DN8186_c0_g1_i2:212-922(+)
MENYEKSRMLGQGEYGVVFYGERLHDRLPVAIKRIKNGEHADGVDFVALREVKFLREIHSEYIVELLDVFIFENQLHLVLEFMTTDLEKILRNKSIPFGHSSIKCCLEMILRGIDILHSSYVIHRDLTPGNLLISSDGQMKIHDFGLARRYGDDVPMSPEVVTLWYRPPELLYGAERYGTSVDMWSIGCIFAEMMLREPYMPIEDNSEINQLSTIFAARGTPSIYSWPVISRNKHY